MNHGRSEGEPLACSSLYGRLSSSPLVGVERGKQRGLGRARARKYLAYGLEVVLQFARRHLVGQRTGQVI